jgi:tRNA-dihydrouridine synthase
MNFWEKTKKPILCLAPMADVTDAAFRFIISKNSDIEHVTYTEFVSADGLVLAPEAGRKKLLKDFEYDEIERPIVAQIFGSKPENIEKAATLVAELGFDGVDINMGCPDKSIEKQGAGAALMKNPKLAREIISAAKRGVQNNLSADEAEIPVSIKTRLGYNKDELETWLPELLAENPAAIIIHARTRKEMSKVPARWEKIKRAVEIRDSFTTATERNSLRSQDASHISLREFSLLPKTLIIGNGDAKNIEDAVKKCEESGADGAMFGRAIFGNPFLFKTFKKEQKGPELVEGQITTEKRLKVMMEHTRLFEEKFGGIKSFAIMKKHFKEYLKTPELRDLKFKLMRTQTAKEAEKIISCYF